MSMNMPNMLAYTIRSSIAGGNNPPSLIVGYGSNGTAMKPNSPQDDSYWIVFLNAKNPREKVKEWVVPGNQNTAIPGGIDTYMNNPDYLFCLTTQYLSTLHVPQGDFYDFLVKHGAGRELQKLEQVNTVLSCGSYSRVSYILTGQCGVRDPKKPPLTSYELGSYSGTTSVMMLMSLMPQQNGSPPYSICDSYTFKTR